jgi:hypothetical protein
VVLSVAAYYVVEGRRRTHEVADALTAAKAFRVHPGGPTLERALATEHRADLRWEAVPGHDGAGLPRVRAFLEIDGKAYDYRFDVDIDSGVVHPANPRARELLETLRTRE